MRLGLLRCDEVGGDRESRFGGYLKLFADLFAKVDTGVDITDYDVAGGVLPADPGEQDGWLISGARASVVDRFDWEATAARYRALLQDAARARAASER